MPESKSLDSVGTFGRTVLDAALALDAIKDVDRTQISFFFSEISVDIL